MFLCRDLGCQDSEVCPATQGQGGRVGVGGGVKGSVLSGYEGRVWGKEILGNGHRHTHTTHTFARARTPPAPPPP